MNDKIPANSRAKEPIITVTAHLDQHDCTYCGTRAVSPEYIDTEGLAKALATKSLPAQCPHCGQQYSLEVAKANGLDDDDPGNQNANLTAQEIFTKDIAPILNLLGSICESHNYSMLAMFQPPPEAFTPEPQERELFLEVVPYANEMIPSAIHHAMSALQELNYLSDGPATIASTTPAAVH